MIQRPSAIELHGLVKEFGKVRALGPVGLTIGQGEFFSLLGPSGCGKTTTLRLIAGLEAPSSGQIMLEGRDVTTVPTHRRGIGMVFQSYALFPHRNVYDNVAFGLRMRGMDRALIKSRVDQALAKVDLAGYQERYPAQLSGGQQQRVALARAIVYEPSVLLFDEPLSNLDAKLREQMRSEIRNLTRSLSVTSVYVTHDQAEALALSDRIAVLNRGEIVQVGTPNEIYERPRSRFVADFIGAANLLRVRLAGAEKEHCIAATSSGVRLELVAQRNGFARNGSDQVVLIRPERIQVHETRPNGPNALQGKVTDVAYLGSYARYAVEVADDLDLTVVSDRIIRDCGIGRDLWLSISREDITLIEEAAANGVH